MPTYYTINESTQKYLQVQCNTHHVLFEGRCSKERCSFKLKIHSMSRVWLWSQEKVLKVT